MKKSKQSSSRLVSCVVPLRYRLTLRPDISAAYYEGEEIISLVITQVVKSITLHAKDLILDHKVVKIVSKSLEVKAIKLQWNVKTETVTLVFGVPLIPGEYELYLNFQGKFSENLRGFYLSKYTVAGREHKLAVTQFEATDARRAFPCFDEPSMKAIFEVSFIIPENLVAISNTLPVVSEILPGGKKQLSFAPTPKMSTYLLAFIVGNFEHLEAKTHNGVLVRVYVTPGKLPQAKFALDCAVKCLEFFNKYYGVEYPLNSLDLIGIPDFAAGAMENWGAVTYRESQLLVDETNSSTSTKQWTALTIAHELAHQWFGNLVTMEWWTHLWLNEGFASYMEYVAIDAIFPDWEIWNQFVYFDFNTALELDALINSHPIEIPVRHPDEIGEIFDTISYNKGASIIRMLAAFLGEKVFQKGLAEYLKTHAYKNASTEDLWLALESVSGKPVKKIMNNWVKQVGYPVISVSRSGDKLLLRQTRFLAYPHSRKKNLAKVRWGIPLSVSINGKLRSVYFENTKKDIPLPKISEPCKLNFGEVTPGRVHYSPELLQALVPGLHSQSLPTVDRLGLIRDAFALCKAGLMDLIEYLNFCRAYKSETEYVVWAEINSQFSELYRLFYGHPLHKHLKKYFLELNSSILEILGVSPKHTDTHTQKLLRPLILNQCGIFGDPKIIDFAKAQFGKRKKLSGDIKGFVLNINIFTGGEYEYQELLQSLFLEQNAEERNRLMRALGLVQKKAAIRELLAMQTKGKIRMQDGPTFLAGIYANPASEGLPWEYFKKHYDFYEKNYGQGGHTFDRIILMNRHYRTLEFLQDFREFFKTRKASGGARAVLQVQEQVLGNLEWHKRCLKDFENYFSE